MHPNPATLPEANESNLLAILQNLFQNLGIIYTNYYLKTSLQVSDISIKSIKQLLSIYQLAVLPVELGVFQLSEIPYPALIQYKNGAFAVLQTFENEQVSLFNNEKGNYKIAVNDFAKIWSGITLLIEKNENSAEPNYKENKKQEIIENLRVPLLLLVLGLVIGYQAMQFTNMVSFAWLATKLVGTILSVLLLWQSLEKNSLIAKLCSFNKKTDCNSLLTSPAATLFGVVS